MMEANKKAGRSKYHECMKTEASKHLSISKEMGLTGTKDSECTVDLKRPRSKTTQTRATSTLRGERWCL